MKHNLSSHSGRLIKIIYNILYSLFRVFATSCGATTSTGKVEEFNTKPIGEIVWSPMCRKDWSGGEGERFKLGTWGGLKLERLLAYGRELERRLRRRVLIGLLIPPICSRINYLSRVWERRVGPRRKTARSSQSPTRDLCSTATPAPHPPSSLYTQR